MAAAYATVGTSSTALVSESRSKTTCLVATALALALPLVLVLPARDEIGSVLDGGGEAGATAAAESFETMLMPKDPLLLPDMLPLPVLVAGLVEVLPLTERPALALALMLTAVEVLRLHAVA